LAPLKHGRKSDGKRRKDHAYQCQSVPLVPRKGSGRIAAMQAPPQYENRELGKGADSHSSMTVGQLQSGTRKEKGPTRLESGVNEWLGPPMISASRQTEWNYLAGRRVALSRKKEEKRRKAEEGTRFFSSVNIDGAQEHPQGRKRRGNKQREKLLVATGNGHKEREQGKWLCRISEEGSGE